MKDFDFQSSKLNEKRCVIFIGMAGAGKSTVAKALAERLGWPFMDTDHLIEAHYGSALQEITNTMSKEEFLDLETEIVQRTSPRRTIIATGGSVVYRLQSIEHLRSIGPIIYLKTSLQLTKQRIAMHPERGLAIAPGQTIDDIYNERQALYADTADMTLPCDSLTPEGCVDAVIAWLQENEDEKA